MLGGSRNRPQTRVAPLRFRPPRPKQEELRVAGGHGDAPPVVFNCNDVSEVFDGSPGTAEGEVPCLLRAQRHNDGGFDRLHLSVSPPPFPAFPDRRAIQPSDGPLTRTLLVYSRKLQGKIGL